MKRQGVVITAAALVLCSMGPSLWAQEGPRRHYSEPIGLTQAEAIRVVVAPVQLRFQGPASLCQIEVTLEIVDALDMTVLATQGPIAAAIGSSFIADFSPNVGAPPERQEVIVRTTVERKPARAAEQRSLTAVCPVVGSAQVYDVSTGRTLQHHICYQDGDDLYFQ